MHDITAALFIAAIVVGVLYAAAIVGDRHPPGRVAQFFLGIPPEDHPTKEQ